MIAVSVRFSERVPLFRDGHCGRFTTAAVSPVDGGRDEAGFQALRLTPVA